MATQYGFRLFRIALRKGMTRTDVPFNKAFLNTKTEQGPLIEEILATAERIKGRTETEVLRYITRAAPAADLEVDDANLSEKEDTVPFIRLVSFERDGQRIDFAFRFGRKGSHDLAIAAAEEDDAPLDERSPTNEFRASLYVPDVGMRGLLVCEARNSICPAAELLRLLGVSMKRHDERPDEESLGWWRLLEEPLTDSEHLKRFIRDGQATGIRLLKKKTNSAGTGEDVITLRQDGVPVSKIGRLKTTVGDWLGLTDAEVGGAQEKLAGKSVPKQIASLMDITVKASEWDEAGVDWEGPDGSTRFVKPAEVRDVFTYRVGKRGHRPTPDTIRRAAESTFLPLLKSEKIELDLAR